MSTPITIKEHQQFIGINNLKSPETLEPNELVEAVNVDITAGGLLKSADTEIDFTNADTNNRVVINGRTYTCEDLKLIYSGNSNTKPLPCKSIIEFYSGRFFSAMENTLYISDPLDFGSLSIPDGFLLVEEPIKNIKAVDDGMYISTETKLLFLSGGSPKEFRLKTIEKFNVIKNSMVKVPITIFGKGTDINELLQTYYSKDGKIVVFLSNDGIYVGLNGGVIYNLTKGRYGKIIADEALVVYSDNKIYFKLLGG